MLLSRHPGDEVTPRDQLEAMARLQSACYHPMMLHQDLLVILAVARQLEHF